MSEPTARFFEKFKFFADQMALVLRIPIHKCYYLFCVSELRDSIEKDTNVHDSTKRYVQL